MPLSASLLIGSAVAIVSAWAASAFATLAMAANGLLIALLAPSLIPWMKHVFPMW